MKRIHLVNDDGSCYCKTFYKVKIVFVYSSWVMEILHLSVVHISSNALDISREELLIPIFLENKQFCNSGHPLLLLGLPGKRTDWFGESSTENCNVIF